MRGLALLAGLCLSVSAQTGLSSDPLTRVLAEKEKTGLHPAQIFTVKDCDPVLGLVLFQAKGALQELSIYALKGPAASRVFDQSSQGRLEFDFSQGKGAPDLLHDGSRALLFNEWDKDGRRTLHLLRLEKGRLKEFGAYPEGEIRDLGDKALTLLTRGRPFAKFSARACAAFAGLGAAARQTEVLLWNGKRFKTAVGRFPEFFMESVVQDEQALQAAGDEKDAHPGEYLGAALTLYYDRAAKGEKRAGWDSVAAMLKSLAKEQPGQAECLTKLRSELRSQLAIPAEWP
jgi:hypothetical protein